MSPEPRSTMDRFRRSKNFIPWFLILVNAPGLIAYIFFASGLWIPPGQEGLPHDARGDLLWGLAVFPFLAVCTLINLIMSRPVLIHLFCTATIACFRYGSSSSSFGSALSNTTLGGILPTIVSLGRS